MVYIIQSFQKFFVSSFVPSSPAKRTALCKSVLRALVRSLLGREKASPKRKWGKRSFLDEEKVRSESKKLAHQSSHVHCLTSLSFSLCVPGIGSERQFWGGSKSFKWHAADVGWRKIFPCYIIVGWIKYWVKKTFHYPPPCHKLPIPDLTNTIFLLKRHWIAGMYDN